MRRCALVLCQCFALGLCHRPRPCYGTSPTGVNWTFAETPHTGTRTVVNFLTNSLRVPTCKHGHFFGPWAYPRAWNASATFGFAFVANPFKRLYTHALQHGAAPKERNIKAAGW